MFGAICSHVRFYTTDDGTQRLWKLRLFLLLMFIIGVIEQSRTVQTLFILAFPLCLPSIMIAYYWCWAYFLMHSSNVVTTKFLAARIGDLGLAAIGCLFGISYQLVFGFSFNTVMLF